MNKFSNLKCQSCTDVKAYSQSEIGKSLTDLGGAWKINSERRLEKFFKFSSYRESVNFANRVADLAEEEGHHPRIHIIYQSVIVDTRTHAANGLTVNDFILASKIDKIRPHG